MSSIRGMHHPTRGRVYILNASQNAHARCIYMSMAIVP